MVTGSNGSLWLSSVWMRDVPHSHPFCSRVSLPGTGMDQMVPIVWDTLPDLVRRVIVIYLCPKTQATVDLSTTTTINLDA
jgi:hypothetical protein